MRLRDKVVLVTGAAGGIGAATARRFGREVPVGRIASPDEIASSATSGCPSESERRS